VRKGRAKAEKAKANAEHKGNSSFFAQISGRPQQHNCATFEQVYSFAAHIPPPLRPPAEPAKILAAPRHTWQTASFPCRGTGLAITSPARGPFQGMEGGPPAILSATRLVRHTRPEAGINA